MTPDVSYHEIENGEWLTDTPYASMHRVIVADGCKGKGVAGKMFAYGFSMAERDGFDSVRIDTHPGNIPMQRALGKAGFKACGEIHLAQGTGKRTYKNLDLRGIFVRNIILHRWKGLRQKYSEEPIMRALSPLTNILRRFWCRI